jgi:hypothetical protein
MDYTRLIIHPASDDAGAKIGEVVHELGGQLNEKKLLGMHIFEAMFFTTGNAEKALQELQEYDFISHVEWVETT